MALVVAIIFSVVVVVVCIIGCVIYAASGNSDSTEASPSTLHNPLNPESVQINVANRPYPEAAIVNPCPPDVIQENTAESRMIELTGGNLSKKAVSHYLNQANRNVQIAYHLYLSALQEIKAHTNRTSRYDERSIALLNECDGDATVACLRYDNQKQMKNEKYVPPAPSSYVHQILEPSCPDATASVMGGISHDQEMLQLGVSLETLQRDNDICAICLELDRDTVFQCGHQACHECAYQLEVCHICRHPIEMRIRFYNN